MLKLGDQAKLARSQQSAQLVLDSLPDAVIVMSPDATVELANAAARRMIGSGPVEAFMILHPVASVATR
ncbi:MAG: PAS domain-containing protein [bacterium]|nr:PAS domain-containing protein [bacterium]